MLYNYIHPGANTIQFFFLGIWINSTFYLIHDGYSKTRLLIVIRTIIAVQSTVIQEGFDYLRTVLTVLEGPSCTQQKVTHLLRMWGDQAVVNFFLQTGIYVYIRTQPVCRETTCQSWIMYALCFFGSDLWYAAVYMCIIGSTDNATYGIEYTILHKRSRGCPFLQVAFISNQNCHHRVCSGISLCRKPNHSRRSLQVGASNSLKKKLLYLSNYSMECCVYPQWLLCWWDGLGSSNESTKIPMELIQQLWQFHDVSGWFLHPIPQRNMSHNFSALGGGFPPPRLQTNPVFCSFILCALNILFT